MLCHSLMTNMFEMNNIIKDHDLEADKGIRILAVFGAVCCYHALPVLQILQGSFTEIALQQQNCQAGIAQLKGASSRILIYRYNRRLSQMN